MRKKIREVIHKSGNYMEIDMFPVTSTTKRTGARKKKFKPTSAAQANLNQRNREKHILRLMRENFTENDIEITLTYSDNPTKEEALKRHAKYIRRVRAEARKRGKEIKALYTHEQQKNGKIHHHTTMTGVLSRDEFESLWEYGRANARRLQFGRDGLEGLAKYKAKEAARSDRGIYRTLGMTRNMKKPEKITRDGHITQKEMINSVNGNWCAADFERRYKGYTYLGHKIVYNDFNGNFYVYVDMIRTERFKRRKGEPLQT